MAGHDRQRPGWRSYSEAPGGSPPSPVYCFHEVVSGLCVWACNQVERAVPRQERNVLSSGSSHLGSPACGLAARPFPPPVSQHQGCPSTFPLARIPGRAGCLQVVLKICPRGSQTVVCVLVLSLVSPSPGAGPLQCKHCLGRPPSLSIPFSTVSQAVKILSVCLHHACLRNVLAHRCTAAHTRR